MRTIQSSGPSLVQAESDSGSRLQQDVDAWRNDRSRPVQARHLHAGGVRTIPSWSSALAPATLPVGIWKRGDAGDVRRFPESFPLAAEIVDLRPHAGEQELGRGVRDACPLQHPDLAVLARICRRMREILLRTQ